MEINVITKLNLNAKKFKFPVQVSFAKRGEKELFWLTSRGRLMLSARKVKMKFVEDISKENYGILLKEILQKDSDILYDDNGKYYTLSTGKNLSDGITELVEFEKIIKVLNNS